MNDQSVVDARRAAAWKAIRQPYPDAPHLQPDESEENAAPPLATTSAETHIRRVAFLQAYNNLHPKAFQSVRRYPALFAECSWGTDGAMVRSRMDKFVTSARFDAQWFRLVVWQTAKRIVKYGAQHPCPDFSLISPSGQDGNRERIDRISRSAKMAVRVLVDGWSLRRTAKTFGVTHTAVAKARDSFEPYLHLTSTDV